MMLPLISCTQSQITPPEASPTETEISANTERSAIEFIGEARLPTGLIYEETEFGGISGITYDADNQVYYAISDDRSQKADARFYTLKIDISSVKVLPEITVTTLFNAAQQPFEQGTLDPEGIAVTDQTLTGEKRIYIASEGDRDRGIQPFINEFSLDGQLIRMFPIPEKLLPSPDQEQGVRNNLSLESLTIAPDYDLLFSAPENALIQDGLSPNMNQGTPARILQYNLQLGLLEKEYLYVTEPVADAANPPDSLQTNGLVELLAIDDTKLLSLERSYSNGVGNTILLFEVSLENASEIQDIQSLREVDISAIQPAAKRLLLDLRSLNIPLDNIEGMTFGPTLPDGRRSLILISDNNFNPLQVTQILVFGIRQP
jgi:hypothetical protein